MKLTKYELEKMFKRAECSSGGDYETGIRILLGIVVLLAAICLGQIWIKHQEKVRTMAEQAAKG
ncbi:hypothetical protein ABTK14_21600, partial [Acinetobacter baumannii]